MATLYLTVALVTATIAVIFALQNAPLVTVSFLSWTTSGSLSLVLLITLAIGVLIGLLVLAPAALKKTIVASNQRKRIDILENEVKEHKAKVIELQKQATQPSSSAWQTPSDLFE